MYLLLHLSDIFFLKNCNTGTSLCISPSGNFVWGGFSDGTIRVFDNSGKFDLYNNNDDKLKLYFVGVSCCGKNESEIKQTSSNESHCH